MYKYLCVQVCLVTSLQTPTTDVCYIQEIGIRLRPPSILWVEKIQSRELSIKIRTISYAQQNEMASRF